MHAARRSTPCRGIALAAVASLVASALLARPSSGAEATPTVKESVDPTIDPADFVSQIDNPYYPLTPGTTFVYDGEEDGEAEHTETEVTSETKTILGVTCVVVHDQVWVEGELAEDTLDWYAQDKDGNVWYFGEDSKEIEDGEVVSTEGSWEAGADGAQPGIVMLADPQVGDSYRQEYYEGEAEDMGEVIGVGESVTVGETTYDHALVTRDWNPLEPGVVEEKTYAPDVGLVLEELVEGGEGRSELVEVRGAQDGASQATPDS
jgi:hypothetical protein